LNVVHFTTQMISMFSPAKDVLQWKDHFGFPCLFVWLFWFVLYSV